MHSYYSCLCSTVVSKRLDLHYGSRHFFAICHVGKSYKVKLDQAGYSIIVWEHSHNIQFAPWVARAGFANDLPENNLFHAPQQAFHFQTFLILDPYFLVHKGFTQSFAHTSCQAASTLARA